MSIKQCCSLCCTTCNEYKLLQNEIGECNEFYEITVKYFDPMLLTGQGNTTYQLEQALCQNCWFHIEEFHEFQETVLKTRMLWEENVNIKPLRVEVKQEDGQQDDNLITNMQSDEVNNTGEKDQYDSIIESYQNFKRESVSICEDTLESFKIDNGSNSIPEDEKCNSATELLAKRRRGRRPKNKSNQFAGDTESEDEETGKRKTHKLTPDTKQKGPSALNMAKARESDAFIAEWKPELLCDLCGESSTNFDKLRVHFKETHKSRFYIKCCERKFFRRCVFVNHIQLHLNPETFKCDICGKSSTTKHNLKLHKKVMHQDTKQLKCNVCEKLFKQKVTLERHMLTHSTESKDFICSECGKGYVAERLLKLHIKQVHDVDRVCDQCGKSIHGYHALKKHLMEHDGIERRKYRCDICGIELTSPNGLKRHKASFHNDGSTIYVCSVCGKVAASENALRNHKKLVHMQERKHKCNYCDKAFKRPKSLREHIASHTGQDLYQCPHCPQTFKVSGNMHHHRKKVHPIEWEEARKHRREQPKIDINQVKKQVVL